MIRVIGDRVLVALAPPPPEKVTESGIILVKDPDRYKLPSQGIVTQLGQKSNTCDLDEVRSEVHTWFVEHAEPGSTGLNAQQADDAIDRVLMAMAPAAFDVAVGDCVLFSPGAGEEFHEDGIDYVVLSESEVIGIVEPKSEAA